MKTLRRVPSPDARRMVETLMSGELIAPGVMARPIHDVDTVESLQVEVINLQVDLWRLLQRLAMPCPNCGHSDDCV